MTGRVLVTGATGFVGRALVPALSRAGWTPVPVGRAETGPIGAGTDWRPHLDDVEAIIHLAAAGVQGRHWTAAQLEETNVAGTRTLAAAGRDAGVGRFVFVSSARALCSSSRRPLTAADPPAPDDPYGASKLAGEAALIAEAGAAMQTVILRPPLVYGPGAGGAFGRLAAAVRRGAVLPLASIPGRRSVIYVGNLADALVHALTCSPGIYLPSDRTDVTPAELVRVLAAGMGRRPRLLPCPAWALRLAGRLTGRGAAIERLLASFQVDGVLPGWQPPVPFETAIARSVQDEPS